MAIQFRLPEDVRNKYDLPEWVSYDPEVLMLSEAIAMQDTIGIDPLKVYEKLTTRNGATPDYRVWGYVIWLACHRAGATVTFADFDLDLYALNTASDSADSDDQDATSGPKETAVDAPSTPESSSGAEPASSPVS